MTGPEQNGKCVTKDREIPAGNKPGATGYQDRRPRAARAVAAAVASQSDAH